MNAFVGHYKPVSQYNKNHIAIIECVARGHPKRRIVTPCHILHHETLHEVYMTSVDLSLFIEANYPISGRGGPRKPRYGVGVNDADYAAQPIVNGNQIKDPAYQSWVDMLKRAYDPKLHEKYPTYSDVTVCKEWHSFSAFRAWWLDNYREGWHLDKDILVVGNREYGPDACIYVPRWLNAFTIGSGASRGELPIGVSIYKPTGKYKSECRNPITGKRNYLGLFSTPEQAYSAWLKCKLQLADQLKQEMDAIDTRIYPNVVTIIKAAV